MSAETAKFISTFPIVGIGASAGGLEAFIEIFKKLPADTGMAFVLVQHLSPTSASGLSAILQKITQMTVLEITDGMAVEPNHIYVIPPDASLEIFHGILHLEAVDKDSGRYLPIDKFFISLARDQNHLSVAVVLSGSGSDGARGLREIKSNGGITFAQDPAEAKFNSMPKAAIAESLPDLVLKIDALVIELIHIAKNPIAKRKSADSDTPPSPEIEKILQKIYILIRRATKIDFSSYKYPTVIRRIKRRMVLQRLEKMKHYLTFLQTTPSEVTTLFDDLLINVTDFFRDPGAFFCLKEKVFPKILEGRAEGATIRIWVPACSSGQEVYSITILLLDFLGDRATKFPIQIYGTDISASALKVARAGLYTESAVKSIPPELLSKFFIREQSGYRVSRTVRESCIFSIQDITCQPPINRLDLLSCRNLLIYLDQAVQKKLTQTFSYALKNENGFLLLGSAETIASGERLFSTFDAKSKIFLKKNSNVKSSRRLGKLSLDPLPFLNISPSEPVARVSRKPLDLVSQTERLVLDKYAPAWVLVNAALDIVQFRGETDRFIAPASGQPSWNLMKMLNAGLSTHVRVLIRSSTKTQKACRKDGLRFSSGGIKRAVDIEVVPLPSMNAERHYLILFMAREIVKPPLISGGPKHLKGKKADFSSKEINRLQEELDLTQNTLRTIIEDLNATNEEMQSANEEASSANEELQSTIEELETAKEELQSTNEELTTLNDELSTRNADLDHLTNDLMNVLSNANVSIVMVGPDMRIRRFTPMAEKRLKLITTDIGRNLMDINLGFAIAEFEKKVAQVIHTMSTIELETKDPKGDWYSIQIRPYRTTENKVDGAVIVFTNIDDIKERESHVLESERYSDSIIQTVRDPLIVLDHQLRVERANQAYYDTFHVDSASTIGRPFYDLGTGQWNQPELRALLEEVLPKKREVRDYIVSHTFEGNGRKQMVLNARTLEWQGQKKHLLLISLRDCKDSKGQNT